ncbi:MAG: signal peptidase I [Pseudomonadota bacterium]
MNINFELVMVVALVVCLALTLLDVYVLRPKRLRAQAALRNGPGPDDERVQAAGREPVLIEYARAFWPVLLIVLVLRSFVIEPFRIPSGSMMPTLLVGDFIMVNKYAYGLRLPVVKTKIFDIGAPERGDVVVFRYPKEPSIDYIKRVVGVPGDVIGYYDKQLYINGKPLTRAAVGRYEGVGAGVTMSGNEVYQETLSAVTHQIMIDPHKPTQSGEITVPPGHYFVMGDNRDNSNDSRFWGMVPEANLVGKAFMIWMNWDDGIAFSRIGNIIE